VVRISYVTGFDSFTLAFTDNGIGLNAGDQDKIFHYFSRLHPQEKFEGTGIGLAVCKRIVELHSGHIWVESKPGEGSTFFVELPSSFCKIDEVTHPQMASPRSL
jgi:signal transduction histidine kinase